MTALTAALADFVAAPRFGPDEEAALDVARTGFIDTVATLIAGRAEPLVDILLRRLDAQQAQAAEAPVLFAPRLCPSVQAALINGAAAHALDYDDVALSAHTSTVLVPAILAEGHFLAASGRDALRAYLVGYEVWAELFHREQDQYHLKGWHPTGVFGAVGAAAAVAYLHRLPRAQVQHALGIAASMAGGLVANFGSMAKPLHAGRAAAAGIEAVRLAQLGLTAAPDVFEHPAGFLNAISPAGRWDRAGAGTRLGTQLHILASGLSVKQYPVCYSGHRAIDGMLDLVLQADVQPQEVRSVRVSLGKAQASMLRNHRPRTGLEAKFSLEFAVACALVARRVTLAELQDGFVHREDIRAAIEKVAIEVVDTQCPIDPAFAFADRVVMQLHDGRMLDSGEIRFARGNAQSPLSAAALRDKFLACTASHFEAPSATGGAQALHDRLRRLEELVDLRRLFEDIGAAAQR